MKTWTEHINLYLPKIYMHTKKFLKSLSTHRLENLITTQQDGTIQFEYTKNLLHFLL